MPAQPEITKSRPLPIVWIVPVLALAVAGYLIFKEVSERGPRITIIFNEGSGLEAGKTTLQHKGMTVGIVDSVALSQDLSKVEAVVELQKWAKGLARDGSKFWILRPEIGFEGVRGLNTLLSGPTLQVSPGIGPYRKIFEGLERAPHDGDSISYTYILRVDHLGSLKAGSPVLYREYKVGEVIKTALAPDATCVLVEIAINAPYDKLVRIDTRFWNASGIAMKVGLMGAKIHTNSVESMLAGGIMFATPYERDQLAELAPERSVFELESNHQESWLKWAPPIPLAEEAAN